MFRSRTSSATITSNNQSEIPSLLSPISPRNRAIENDYTEHPATFRPASAPTVPSVLHREPRIHTERLLGRESSRNESHHHRSHSQDRHVRPYKHHHHHGDGVTRSRRHCMPLPLPGQATRVSASATSLPSYYVSRERSNRLDAPSDPILPPRSHPSTIGHLPPRRGSKPAPQLPIDMAVTSIPEDPGTLPERSLPHDVSSRLRMRSVDTPAQTTQPRSRFASTASDRVIMSQPLQCMREGTPPVLPNNNVPKKDLIVDLKPDQLTQTRTMSDKKSDKSAVSKSGSLKKNSETEPMLRTDDSDHVLRPDDVETRGKPGDHNYPCPRCGKCTCFKCQGRKPSSAVPQPTPHCWMCNHRCLCDVKSCIEYGTCICVARACFYHCTRYEDDEVATDKPCSCRGSDCCFRWTALGALSVILPCLWCYPVASCCLKACKTCADCVRPGCRCKESYR